MTLAAGGMHPTAKTTVTVITDPIADDESRHVLRCRHGFVTAQGSPVIDGTPIGSRAVFRLDHADLASGGRDARIDTLTSRGIGVHRVLGEHPRRRRRRRATRRRLTHAAVTPRA